MNPFQGYRTRATGELTRSIEWQQFAVVGMYVKDRRPFVQHAALLAKDTQLSGEAPVAVHHMGPPMEQDDQCLCHLGQRGAQEEMILCHLVGQVNLTLEEQEAIATWIASVATQYTPVRIKPFQQYSIAPHMKWVIAETGRPLRQRFSCVGYVVEAYLAAGIALIDQSSLPLAEQAELALAYPQLQRIAEEPRLGKHLGYIDLADLGLTGEGPWPVLLAGHVFHATRQQEEMNRRPDTPFQPTLNTQAYYPIP